MNRSIVLSIDNTLSWFSRQFALAGGLIMVALALMTVASILGRSFAGASIQGDYELVEMGLAISVFLFLPECHQQKGHIVVDFFTVNASKTTLDLLKAISDLLFAVLAALLIWRMGIAALEAYDYQEASMILELPLWAAYVPAIIAMCLLCLCCLFTSVVGGWRIFQDE